MGTSFADVDRVLDFGCGCGRALRWLMESYPATWPAFMEPTSMPTQSIGASGTFLTARSSIAEPDPALPFESSYFDVVYCFFSVHAPR